MPDRPLINIYDDAGILVMRIGDISGMPWGGTADFPLPAGTFGVWSKRGGLWAKAYVAMFYANSSDSGLITHTFANETGNSIAYDFQVDETLPFGTIRVPRGRIVTLEFIPHHILLEWHDPVPGPDGTWAATTDTKLKRVELRASLNGGAVAAYNYLSGPSAGSGDNTYASVVLRVTYVGKISGAFTVNGLRVRRIASLRMFSHEVNTAPSYSVVGRTAGTVLDGSSLSGSDADQGGGSGTESGGYGGDIPGPGELI